MKYYAAIKKNMESIVYRILPFLWKVNRKQKHTHTQTLLVCICIDISGRIYIYIQAQHICEGYMYQEIGDHGCVWGRTSCD